MISIILSLSLEDQMHQQFRRGQGPVTTEKWCIFRAAGLAVCPAWALDFMALGVGIPMLSQTP